MPLTDALFLQAEQRERPMHVGGLQLFRFPGDAGPDAVGRLYRAALEQDAVQRRLRRRPWRLGGVGAWMWEDDPDLELSYHVRHSALPHPGRVRELLVLVSRLHGTLLDRTRALWEVHFIEGLPGGRFALYGKMHHALVDGVAAMQLMQAALSEDPDALVPPPWVAPDEPSPEGPGVRPASGRAGTTAGARGQASAPPGLREALTDAARGAVAGVRAIAGSGERVLRSLLDAFEDQAAVLPYQAPCSILNVPITGARRFAADSWSLERIGAVRRATGATLNDVVLALCSGALRRYLLDVDALPEAPLVAAVPVSLRDKDAPDARANAVGVVLCSLGTHLADPEARLTLIRESMERGKLGLKGLDHAGILVVSALAFGGLALAPLFRFEPLRRPPFNLIISNVPGPRAPLYYNGARLEGVYPLSIPLDGQALNITVTTYVDHLEVGLTGCRRSVPHLQALLEHLESSLVELEGVAAV